MKEEDHSQIQHLHIRSIIHDAFKVYDTDLRSISKKIHEYRETAYEEFQSSKLLTDFLENQGFIVERHIANRPTAFVATFQSSNGNGRTVSFNSEYDALPEIGHACGHNLICITGLGAALALKAYLTSEKKTGTIKLFGTPAEERGGGKTDLINAGYYKQVDMNLMLHPAPRGGGAFIRYLAITGFDVEYFGKAVHAAASPWEGRNALDALISAFNSMNALRQQLHPTARIHGIIVNGGTTPNVIPDYTKGTFLIRALNVDLLLTDVKPRVMACFEAGAKATGCEVKITETGLRKDVKFNQVLAERYEQYAKIQGSEILSKEEQSKIALASTDQGNVSYEVPAIHAEYRINPNTNMNKESTIGFHTKEFEVVAITEEAYLETIKASEAMAATAIDFLEDDLFAKNVIDEFKCSVVQ
ncbi:unnamed protein product [Didymodactylos carnosus]|uniref:Peptidase M20 domain-containing protein 2 n=1 Tax=Didymodactylos carnosus TaxID=1234261 RepID=A0A815BW82_9BILA|nr:unnamed protein product [Didymodactylos carnosus]CAF1275421.1 unnamed protein product [Didymodactylos carnosus]CAF3839358.1 unnamed protein product [Didymodactylos carnosus]CAF4066341.1 unnamed protein product [Didymodactylos carnosus]